MTQSNEPIPNYHVYGEREKQSPTTLYWGTSRAEAEGTYETLMSRYMIHIKATLEPISMCPQKLEILAFLKAPSYLQYKINTIICI